MLALLTLHLFLQVRPELFSDLRVIYLFSHPSNTSPWNNELFRGQRNFDLILRI